MSREMRDLNHKLRSLFEEDSSDKNDDEHPAKKSKKDMSRGKGPDWIGDEKRDSKVGKTSTESEEVDGDEPDSEEDEE